MEALYHNCGVDSYLKKKKRGYTNFSCQYSFKL